MWCSLLSLVGAAFSVQSEDAGLHGARVARHNTRSAEVGAGASMMRRERLDNTGHIKHRDPWEPNITLPDGSTGEGPCDAGICGNGHVLKPLGKRPLECEYLGHCSPEECCFGYCDSAYSCPEDSTRSDTIPQACEAYECTHEECCVGTCNPDHCPGFSVPMALEHRPEKCQEHPCAEEECCLGICAGIECPPGSLRKNDSVRPEQCRQYPCKEMECCEAACTESLCTFAHTEDDGKVLRTFNTTGGETLMNVCKDFPCEIQECCRGTCDDPICGDHQPPLLPADMPTHCEGYDCTPTECCEGRCSAHFCNHFKTSLKDNVTRDTFCETDPCKPHDCCAGECVESQCPSDFGLIRKEHFPNECADLNCTTAECCDSVCGDSVCPQDRGLVLKEAAQLPDRCVSTTCSRDECCLEQVA